MKALTIAAACIFSLLLMPMESPAQTRVGAILPLSGENSLWGINPRKGIELALRDLKGENEHAPFSVIFEDDKCDPKEAVAAFNKLVEQDGVKIIIGPVCSSCSLAVAPLAERKKILIITFSEAASISDFGDYVFRLYVPNNRQGVLLADYAAARRKYKTAAIISADTAYGHDLSAAFSTKFLAAGGVIVAHETYASENRDFRSALLKLRAKNPDVLLVAAYTPDGIAIYKSLADMKWRVPRFGASTLNTPDFYNALGAQADGTIFADMLDNTSQIFRDRWKREFSEEFPGMQAGGSVLYDFANLLALALKGGESPEAVFQFLYREEAYAGIAGPMAFDRSGDLKWQLTLFSRENGKTIALP